MRKPHLLFLTLPALLASCSMEPPLESINSPVSEGYPGNTGGGTRADIAWNKFFTDPRLKKLVSVALENNRDLRIAALNVELRARSPVPARRPIPALLTCPWGLPPMSWISSAGSAA